MSQSVAAHIQKDKAFANMIQVFNAACHKDGFHPPAVITDELFYKIGRPSATLVNTALNFKECELEDQGLSYLMDALAVYPVVTSLDLSHNAISDAGGRYLLKLLRAQAKLVKNIHIDKRLYASFIGHVDLTDNFANLSPEVHDEIDMMCEALQYANVQTSVRKAFLNNGCRHHVSDSRMKAVWDDIIKEQFPVLREQVVEQEEIRRHYATGVHQYSHAMHPRKRSTSPGRSVGNTSNYSSASIHSGTTHTNVSSRLPVSIAEVSVMRALQAAERVPYLTRWQYALLAVPEIRSDESFSDKSVLYASTVFDQMDSLSISNSQIAFSPVPKDGKSAKDSVRSTPTIQSNAEKLYGIIDRSNKGYFTHSDLQSALESSNDVVEAFMLYMNGDAHNHEKDDLSTLDSGSLFSMPDESKNLVRLMDARNTGRVSKRDFLSFLEKSTIVIGGNLSMKDFSVTTGYENSSPNKSVKKNALHSLNVTFSESGTFQNVSAYTGEYSPMRSGSGATDAATLVTNMMNSFLDRVKYIGSQEQLEEETTFTYDKAKEDEIVNKKQEKVVFFCTDFFDASGTEMETLSIPRSLDYGDYINVRILCLRDNGMITVDGSVLSELPKLRSLDLSHNMIQNMGRKPFPKSLRILNLSYNMLRDTNWSPLFQNVLELNLAGNEISSVDLLPRKVAKLNIADNLISDVVSLRVMALHRITSLTLTGNPVVESTKFLKATISSLFPHLEELDGAMLPRRVNSRILRSASSSMCVSIAGESRGRTSMTQTYQKQLDKKRSDEFKLREEAKQEKLREYIKSFTDKMRSRKTSPQKLGTIIERLYNAKHNSMAHIRGRTPRAGSADSVREEDDEKAPKRNRLSLSPTKIEEMTMRLYKGSHHRVHQGPPPEHPSSPRRTSSAKSYTQSVPNQPFSPREEKSIRRGRNAEERAAVRLTIPMDNVMSGIKEDPFISQCHDVEHDAGDESFMSRPPISKKPPSASVSKKMEPAPSVDYSKQIKPLLNQFIATIAPIKSRKVPEYIRTKIHDIASSIDSFLEPFLKSLEELIIDGVLGIEESPGNFAFHQMNDDDKESHCARWILSQVAACIRSAESEMNSGDTADEEGESTDFPFAECCHMAASMSPFLKENPVNWMFCASVLRRVESKRYPGRKLATYVYAPRSPTPELQSVSNDSPDHEFIENTDNKSIETFSEEPNITEQIKNGESLSVEVEENENEIEKVRDKLRHTEPVVRVPEPTMPTPPDDHILTAKRGIELFERSSSSLADNLAEDTKTEQVDQSYVPLVKEHSFIDAENESVTSPPIIPRRRSKSNSSFPTAEEIFSDGNRSTSGSPVRGDVSQASLKGPIKDDMNEKTAIDSDVDRPSSRNSVKSNITDDQAAGDIFSRMNNLKSRISNASVPTIPRSDSHDENRSVHTMGDEDHSPRLQPSNSVPRLLSLPTDLVPTSHEPGPVEPPEGDSNPVSAVQSDARNVKSPSSPDSNMSNESSMTAVERLKARLSKKSSDKSMTNLDRPFSGQSNIPRTVPEGIEEGEAIISSGTQILTPSKNNNIDNSNEVVPTAEPINSLTPSKMNYTEKRLRKPLTVDANSEQVPIPTAVPTPAAPSPSVPIMVPTPKRSENVGSFSAAIAQALPSPSQRTPISGVSPPQKLLGSAHPPSPGGRMMYRPPGAPSPANRSPKTFDFLDTVMHTMEKSQDPLNDDDSDNTNNSPVANLKVESLTKSRKSLLPTHSISEHGGSPAASSTYISVSPGSLDDVSSLSPLASSTHISGGIASIGKKNPDLHKSRSTPVTYDENLTESAKPPVIQKSASMAAVPVADDMLSETSSAAGDPSRPASLKKKSLGSSMKSFFGLKKKT